MEWHSAWLRFSAKGHHDQSSVSLVGEAISVGYTPFSMDPVLEIKARLPIEELVGQYCQLKKKGKGFVCVCPFHNDSHPSFTVSPDKGIGYCFACQTGGDIFSFYQAIEGVDFRQALKDLAEKTGVKISDMPAETSAKKDEKERARECLLAAQEFYVSNLKTSDTAKNYLRSRNTSDELIQEFNLGYAPDSFSETYQYLLKKGFSRKEILLASLGIQKELSEGKIYDRFRNRLMFPIEDHQGQVIGFGGRTLGEDDAKYINSSDGPLYNKSTVLFGLSKAKEAIRQAKAVILVEGYFDVLACHSIGMKNVVAASGTALTEQHVKVLKRYCDTLILALDQDQAGKDAAHRAFILASKEGLQVRAVLLDGKDPDEAIQADASVVKSAIEEGGKPFFDLVCDEISQTDLSQHANVRSAMAQLLPLIAAVTSSVEREHLLQRAATTLSTTVTALTEDIAQFERAQITPKPLPEEPKQPEEKEDKGFSPEEIAIGMVLCYPQFRELLQEMIAPDKEFAAVLYGCVHDVPDNTPVTVESLDVPEEHKERTSLLLLYCEHHGFSEWSESLARKELHTNIMQANRHILRTKQEDISKKLLEAHRSGKTAEAEQLSTQYQQVLKLSKMTKIS